MLGYWRIIPGCPWAAQPGSPLHGHPGSLIQSPTASCQEVGRLLNSAIEIYFILFLSLYFGLMPFFSFYATKKYQMPEHECSS